MPAEEKRQLRGERVAYLAQSAAATFNPGDPIDKNLYDLPPEELHDVPTVCGSLRQALESLESDHEFLLAGDVFNTDQIEAYSELKWEEINAFEQAPHPIEFQMYYSA